MMFKVAIACLRDNEIRQKINVGILLLCFEKMNHALRKFHLDIVREQSLF